MAGGLSPPPTRAASGDFAWTAWYNDLYKLLSTTGAVNWSQVNKAGSSIADLQNKNHNLLTPIQGGLSAERFHLNQAEYNYVHNSPYIEVIDATNTIALTATPQLLIPPTTVNAQGITYDNTTGEFTFTYAGNYTLVINVNATATTANQTVYIYAETNTGAGWTVNQNSGKSYLLKNAATEQLSFTNAIHRVAGQKVRYKIYSNATNVSLSTFTLPGAVGARIPAIRIQYST